MDFFSLRVKSRLLPLHPVLKALECIVESFPRKRLRAIFKIVSGIDKIDSRKGYYKSASQYPIFELLCDLSMECGWYYIEMALVRNSGNRESFFIAKNVSGKELGVIPISANLRGSIREVFYLPRGVVKLQWVPMTSIGFFSQSPVLLHRIGALESFYRRFSLVAFEVFREKQYRALGSVLHFVKNCTFGFKELHANTIRQRIKRAQGSDYDLFLTRKESELRRQYKLTCRQKKIPTQILPKLSIIVTADFCDAQLYQTVASVALQQYKNWDSVIVVPSGEPTDILDEFLVDSRIKILLCNRELNTAKKKNFALAAAQGDFTLCMRAGDRLHSLALHFVAQKIYGNASIQMIYTDSDIINKKGVRTSPCLKPDWNEDLFLSQDYIDVGRFFKTTCIRDVGGFNEHYDGVEECELIFKVLFGKCKATIAHVPEILYHKNESCDKTKDDLVSHLYGKNIREQFLDNGEIVLNSACIPQTYRVFYSLPSQLPLVSIVIPTRDKVDVLKKCIDSLVEQTHYNLWELIVIDNGSKETSSHNYFREVQANSRIKVISSDEPFNYAKLNNYATRYAQGDVFVFLNNDVEIIDAYWLDEMVRQVCRLEIGCVGAKLLYPDQTIQHAGVFLGIGGIAGHGHRYFPDADFGYCCRASLVQNVSAVTGACLAIRKEVFEQVKGFDEQFAVAFNDVDLCLKVVQKKYRNLYTPYAKLIHHESISRGRDDSSKKIALFELESQRMHEKWGAFLQNDPFYNPNLSHNFENFGLRM